MQNLEFDKNYFSPPRYGYNNYRRNSSFLAIAQKLYEKFNLKNKTVLDVGCAFGFLLHDLRDMGCNAFGLDISNYAISQCDPYDENYVFTLDVNKKLPFKDNEFDLLTSFGLLECISNPTPVIKEFNRISKLQYHKITTQANPDYYFVRSLDECKKLPFNKGTILTDQKKEIIIDIC